MTTTPTSGAADLAARLRNACTSVRSKSYPLADLIPLMQQAADALASTPAQPEVPAGCVAMPRAAISRAIEVLDWLPTSDSMQPLWAKQQAALDELRLSLAAAPAQPVAQQGAAYAATPTSNYAGRVYEEGFLIGTCQLYTADQMRAFADATCALRASHGQAPAGAQNSVLEDALSDAVRVPLDSLHADAAYLIGRLRDGSMPYARVIEIIRERIDAAKAAIRARAAHGQAPADLSPTAGMNIAQRILHVGGRNNDAGYVEFGSIQAVEALVRQVLRDLPAPAPADSVQEDAARLDWLDQQCEAYGFQDIHEGNRWEISGAYADVREAIDAERAARKQGVSHDR